MADVLFTRVKSLSDKQLNDVVEFNKDKVDSQYKYAYIVKLSDGYMVRISQKKPTTKNAINIRHLGKY